MNETNDQDDKGLSSLIQRASFTARDIPSIEVSNRISNDSPRFTSSSKRDSMNDRVQGNDPLMLTRMRPIADHLQEENLVLWS